MNPIFTDCCTRQWYFKGFISHSISDHFKKLSKHLADRGFLFSKSTVYGLSVYRCPICAKEPEQ